MGDREARRGHGRAVGRGDRREAREKGRGDPFGVRLGELGELAVEELVDGRAPQHEPALEVPAAQPHLRVQLGVRAKRAAAVGAGTEQHRLPERGDPRDVRLEVELRDVDEDEADHGVGQRARVERPHEALAVGPVADVHRRTIADHRRGLTRSGQPELRLQLLDLPAERVEVQGEKGARRLRHLHAVRAPRSDDGEQIDLDRARLSHGGREDLRLGRGSVQCVAAAWSPRPTGVRRRRRS